MERVHDFKYLGTVLDSNLTFSDHVDHVDKKALQRMSFLGKLRGFGVSAKVLETVYKLFVESVMTSNIVSWNGFLTVRNKTKLRL